MSCIHLLLIVAGAERETGVKEVVRFVYCQGQVLIHGAGVSLKMGSVESRLTVKWCMSCLFVLWAIVS